MRVACRAIARWQALAAFARPGFPVARFRLHQRSFGIRHSEIPIVNVSGLRHTGQDNEHKRRKIGEELVAAASEVGFFYVAEHGVPESLLRDARQTSRSFFSLPMKAKEKLSIRDEPSRRGYQLVGENITQGSPDDHEAFDVYRDMPAITEAQAQAPTNHGVNKWPAELPAMKSFFEGRYVPAMHELGGVLMRGIALGLGLRERHFESYFTASFWIMRLIRYPPVKDGPAHDRLGCGAHTDYGILTLLNQDLDERHNECLEAQMRDGSWVAVPPREGAMAVNIGDMLALWSGGRLRATPHRVKSPHVVERVAVPFFFEPNYDALIAPLELEQPATCSGRPGAREVEAFAPIRYGDHLLSKVSTNFVDL